MSLGERVKTIRKAESLTLERFGERIGIKKSSLSKIESDSTNPSDQTIKSICREFGISEAWLRDGIGSMYVSVSRDVELEDFVTRLLHDEPESFRRRLISALSRLSESDWEVFARFVSDLADGAGSRPETDPIEVQVEAYRRQLLEERAIRESSDSSPNVTGEAGSSDIA